jgi:hypothetical protein
MHTTEQRSWHSAGTWAFFAYLLFALALCGTANAQTTFTKKTFDTALDPFCLAWGDFNGDGETKIDLATASFSEHAVAVQFNDGSGNFSVPSKFATGNSPQCVFHADVNRDNHDDLIALGSGPNSVSVLLGNGAGSFSAPIVTPLALQPWDMAGGDWNGDFALDLATVDSTTNKVTLLRGHNDGTFTVSTYTVTGATQLRSITSGPFNLFGHGDLAVLDCCTGSEDDPVSNVYTLAGDGAGNFSAKVGIRVRAIPGHITGGWDIDNNGSADIVMTFSNAVTFANKQGIAVLSGSNNGYFKVAKTYGLPSDFDGLIGHPFVADLDGEGRVDIAVAASKDCCTGSDFIDPKAYIATWYLNSDGSLRANDNLLIAEPGYPTGLTTLWANGDHLSDPIDLAMTARTGGTAKLFVLINNIGMCSPPSGAGELHVCFPTEGITTTSPVRIKAAGGSSVTTIEAWMDGTKIGQSKSQQLSLTVHLSPGEHRLTLFARSSGTKTDTEIIHFTTR